MRLEAPIDPGEERIAVRFVVCQAMQPLGLAGNPLVSGLRLDVVEGTVLSVTQIVSNGRQLGTG